MCQAFSSLLAVAPSAPSGDEQTEKNYLGGLTGKFLEWAAPGLVPTSAGDLDGFAPAVLEAVYRYMK